MRRVYLTGEISNFRMRPKHQYFSLKDENAVIDVVMFASDFSKVKFRPEEGMKVIVSGRVDVYEGSGKYQFYVETMEPEGIGALYQALKELQQSFRQKVCSLHRKSRLIDFLSVSPLLPAVPEP